MKLYDLPTMNSRKPCAVAKLLGSPVTYVSMRVGPEGTGSPGYLSLNPNGLCPTLVDGHRVIWESAAIMIHLAAAARSDLWPHDDLDGQVDVVRWISWDACEWSRAVGVAYFERVIRPSIGLGAPVEAAVAQAEPDVRRLAAVLDAHLGTHRYLACGRLTVADFCVAAMLPTWRELALPLGDFRNLVAWNDRLLELPAWADPWPGTTDG